jgi:hypothetical protein
LYKRDYIHISTIWLAQNHVNNNDRISISCITAGFTKFIYGFGGPSEKMSVLIYFLLQNTSQSLAKSANPCYPCQITKNHSILFLIELPVPEK